MQFPKKYPRCSLIQEEKKTPKFIRDQLWQSGEPREAPSAHLEPQKPWDAVLTRVTLVTLPAWLSVEAWESLGSWQSREAPDILVTFQALAVPGFTCGGRGGVGTCVRTWALTEE